MTMATEEFKRAVAEGIPETLPEPKPYDGTVNHAPRRKDILSLEEKVLAIKNALRYFPEKHHEILAKEFADELRTYGRIYMYRFRPDYPMYARPIGEYPARCPQAAAIMAMIQNNLDPRVAQHPHELITYGGNGSVFQNWAQYRLTMKYLSEMTDTQTLVMYSGHPLGLFPSHRDAPRVVVTNGMVIPNYSGQDDWERLNALGVSQYGQMTAGSYMYIGPQGIVHGTTITVMNAARKQLRSKGIPATRENMKGMLFVTSGLGGMSGAQPKAGNISGIVSVTAEINPLAAQKRHAQGWVDEIHRSLDELIPRIRKGERKCSREGERKRFAFSGVSTPRETRMRAVTSCRPHAEATACTAVFCSCVNVYSGTILVICAPSPYARTHRASCRLCKGRNVPNFYRLCKGRNVPNSDKKGGKKYPPFVFFHIQSDQFSALS